MTSQHAALSQAQKSEQSEAAEVQTVYPPVPDEQAMRVVAATIESQFDNGKTPAGVRNAMRERARWHIFLGRVTNAQVITVAAGEVTQDPVMQINAKVVALLNLSEKNDPNHEGKERFIAKNLEATILEIIGLAQTIDETEKEKVGILLRKMLASTQAREYLSPEQKRELAQLVEENFPQGKTSA